MGLAGTLAASAAFCLGYVGQNVLVVYWTNTPLSPYGVLLVNCLFFPAVFGLLLALYALVRRDLSILRTSDVPEERSLLKFGSEAQTLLWVGFFNALNGLGIVFASPPTRTPPLIQAILQNSGAIFSIPFSIWWLGDKKRYLSPWPLLAALLITGSVVVSILPTILDGNASAGVDGGNSVAWCMVYLCGLIPGAAYNVLQQRYLILSGALRQEAPVSRIVTASLRMLFFGCFWMLVFMVALFWTDVLPWFGTSYKATRSVGDDFTSFGELTGFSLACSFGGTAAAGDVGTEFPALNATTVQCDARTPAYAYGFVGSYTVAYIGGAVLNRESSTYTMLNFVLITLLTSAVWYIPGTNPNPEHTPVWSVATSLVLSLLGIVIWKRWEMQSESHEQFHLEPSTPIDIDDDHEGGSGVAGIWGKRGGGYAALRPDDSSTAAPGGGGGVGGAYSYSYLDAHETSLKRMERPSLLGSGGIGMASINGGGRGGGAAGGVGAGSREFSASGLGHGYR